jgi:hypothetical protein
MRGRNVKVLKERIFMADSIDVLFNKSTHIRTFIAARRTGLLYIYDFEKF